MAFPATPLGVVVELYIDAAWTDATSYVRAVDGRDAITITRGRQDEQGRIGPGRANLTFNDAAGRFNNDNPASPYYAKLGRNTPLRVRVGSDVRFTGEVASWQPAWDETGNDTIVPVEASGITRRLDRPGRLVKSAVRQILEAAGPVVYWPIEDDGGATAPASALAGMPPMQAVSGTLDYASDTTVRGSAALARHTSSSQIAGSIPAHNFVATDGWALTWQTRIPEEPVGTLTIMQFFTSGGTVQQWLIQVAPGAPAQLLIQGYDATGSLVISDTTDFTDSAGNEVFGKLLFFDLDAVQQGADVAWSILGVWDGSLNNQVTNFGTHAASTLGYGVSIYNGSPADPLPDVTIGHIGYYLGFLTVFSLLFDVNALFSGERAAARMVRLCADEGITFTLLGNAAETITMGEQQAGNLMELLQQAAEADGGLLYEPRDSLGIEYRTRTNMYSQPAQVELGYATGGHLSTAFKPAIDDQQTRNDVTVGRTGGSSARYVIPDGDFWHLTTEAHPAGVGSYKEGPVALNVELDTDLDELAAWKAHLGAWKEPRVPFAAVDLARPAFTSDAALTADVQAADLGDLIVVDTTAAHAWLPPDEVQLLVQGYTEKLAQFSWVFEWNTTPGLPWEVWQVDTGGSTLAVAVNSSATSLKLATSLGPEWSTTHEPYRIQIAGEAMTVTTMTTDTPAFIAAGTVAHGNNASVTPGLPAGITADVGQSLFIWAAIRNSGTGTVDTPSGWTALVSSGNCALLHRYYTTGVTAPLVTFSGGVANADTSARMFAFSGLSREFAGGTKTVPAAATQLNGSAQNIAYPALNVDRDGGVVLYHGWKQDDWTSVATVGDAEIMDNATTTGDDQGIVADYDIYTTATDVAAGSFTVTGGASAISRAVVVALRPLQTATVTRSVNGVTGSIAAAQAVHGWRLGVNGL